jgi:anti-anti-sigma factor
MSSRVPPRADVQIADGLWSRTSPGTVALLGEVDLHTERALRLAVTAQARLESGPFVLDLTGLDFLDSAGIGALYALARDPDLDFSIRVRAGSMIERLLSLSGLERVLTVTRATET